MAKKEVAKSGLLPIKFTAHGHRALHYISDENILLVESPFADKSNLKRLGGTWHQAIPKGWTWYFTLPNLEMLIDHIPFDEIDPRIEEKTQIELDRIKKIEAIQKAALKDKPISLRVPGIITPEGISLYNYQKLGIQFGNLAERGLLLGDEMGLGKALTLDTKILTPNGWTEMNNISVGDEVVGIDGKSQEVIAVYPHKNKQIYKVSFSDGSSVRCCEDHLWTVYSPSPLINKGFLLRVLSVKELIGLGLIDNNKKHKWNIPITKPVDCFGRHKNLSIISPYILGTLLGSENVVGDQVSIYFSDEERELLKEIDLNKKHIPESYLIAPLKDRVALLQGLMDVNEKIDNQNGVIIYSTISEHLKNGIVELCNSLGGVAVAKKEKLFDKDQNKEILIWTISLSLPKEIQPFYSSEKADAYLNIKNKETPFRAIISIEKDGIEDAQCITVSNADNLFVIKDYIVTHNSLQSIGIALWRKKTHDAEKCLVIAPASLKYNWKEELEFWTNEDFTIIDGSPSKRDELWSEDHFFTVVNPELIIKDYDDVNILKKPFDLIIVDEIHMLKNWKSKRSKFAKKLKIKDKGLKIGLSGTPIDGKLEDLHSIFEFLVPGLFATRGKFLDRYAIRDQFNSVVGYVNVEEVRDTIKPFFLRRLKKDVAKQLPEKIFKNVYVELTTEERKVYNAIKKQSHEITEDAMAITTILRARQFCDAPGLVDEYPEFGAKFTACIELLDEIISNGHKVLVFSMFEQMVEKLYVQFEKNGWKSLKITGATSKKDRPLIARRFNEDENIDICVMDEAGSTGLNFQEASYVLHYDDNWSPAIMKQRTDRAHRITTEHTVNVINFICLNTIEDHVRSSLKAKDSLSADALGDSLEDVSAIKTISAKEAIKLL